MALFNHWVRCRSCQDQAHFHTGKHGIFDLTDAADAPSCARAALTSGGLL